MFRFTTINLWDDGMKKNLEKLKFDSRGVFSVIGAIFFVLIFFVFSYSFIWNLQQNVYYSQGLGQNLRDDQEGSVEDLIFNDVIYTFKYPNQVFIELEMKNFCPFSINIVSLWVEDTTKPIFGYDDALNIIE